MQSSVQCKVRELKMKTHCMQLFNWRNRQFFFHQLTFFPRFPRGPFSPWGPNDAVSIKMKNRLLCFAFK